MCVCVCVCVCVTFSIVFQVEYEFDARYSAMLSNVTMTSLYEANSLELGTVFNRSDEVRQGGSTDMGNVSRVVPSIHPKFGIGTSAGAHTREFQTAAGNNVHHTHTYYYYY